jgi:hypothetical protein
MDGLAAEWRVGSGVMGALSKVASKVVRSGPARVALIGDFGPVQIACIRAWNDRGIRPIFLHTGQGEALRFTRHVLSGYERIPPDLNLGPEFDEHVRSALIRHDCEAVVTVSENQATWLRRLAETCPNKPVACVADSGTIAFLGTKSAQIDLARRSGLDVGDCWLLTSAADADLVPEDAFPIVLRPDAPGTAHPMFKVLRFDAREALDGFLANQRPQPFRIVAQTFVRGPNLVVHGARGVDGHYATHQAFLVDFKFEGVTQRLKPIEISPEFSGACRRFVEQAGLVGVYHFEFILDQERGRILFLEINGRLGGTTGKVYWCGYNEPVRLLQCFGVLPWALAGAPDRIRNRSVSNYFSLLKRLLKVARGSDESMGYPSRSRLSLGIGLIGGILAWTDEIYSLYHWQTMTDYYLDAVQRAASRFVRSPVRGLAPSRSSVAP